MELEIGYKETALNLQPGFIEEIEQNIRHICRTFVGERRYGCRFGIDEGVIDSPWPVALAKLRNEIIEKISSYEPRVQVKQVVMNEVNTNGKLLNKIVVEVINDINK